MMPMVKMYTLFHRVDGFNEPYATSSHPDMLSQDLGDQFLNELLGSLVHAPGEELVKTILTKI